MSRSWAIKESVCQKSRYMPTPGLIALFNKIGPQNPNPNHPKLLPQCSRRSYNDVVGSNIKQGGAPANNNRPGFVPRSYHPGAPQGAGQAEAFCGGFNRPYQGYGGGVYGRKGGVNRFQHLGRGYGGHPMAQRGGFESFHRPQTVVLPS
jgi:hypothetical protein